MSWAEDILKTPYQNLGNAAATHERIAKELGSNGTRERSQASAYRAAQKRYADQVKNLDKGNGLSAAQVIDRRGAFSSVARSIAEDEFKKRKMRATDVSLPR